MSQAARASRPRTGTQDELVDLFDWRFVTDQVGTYEDERGAAGGHGSVGWWRPYDLFCDQTMSTRSRDEMAHCPCVRFAVWERHRAAVLAMWIAQRPGTRPSLWWTFDAPQERRRNEPDVAFLERLKLWAPAERERADTRLQHRTPAWEDEHSPHPGLQG